LKSEKFASVHRKTLVSAIIIIGAVTLGLRLFQMQILNQTSYDDKAADNSIKMIEQLPRRGVFFDRNLKLLVNNIPTYTLRITPADYDKKLNKILESVLKVKPGYINNVLNQNKIYSKYLPLKIKRGINFDIVAWLEENSDNLPGVDYIVEMHRGYPAGVYGSHIFGFAKEISRKQLEKEKEFYKLGDYVGYKSIEKSYEKVLRGTKGSKFVLVNSSRKKIGDYKNGADDIPAIKGKDIVLTIEVNTQRAAEKEFIGKKGALVAIEPVSGEILAMVSSPQFDLKEFSYITSKDFLNKLYNDPGKPLFNRATMSVKPPGSTYKILAAIAGLDLGIITTSTTHLCTGGFTYGRFFKCHGVHGNINVLQAIEKSCNSFFYELILKIGIDRWYEYSRRFGFGSKTNIDIGQESAGLIPDSKYYEKIYGVNWPRSIMLSLVIGQGEVSVTPLQLAQYTALIANYGSTYQPHLVKGYIENNTKKFVSYNYKPFNVGIDKKVFDIVRQGMYRVVYGEGTATRLRYSKYEISGKTGTAQNPHGEDHALFIAFAPFDNPKIAVAVIVENVGFGSTYAAPIAQKVIEAYLNSLEKDESEEVKTISLLKKTKMGETVAN
jgi:penicillin-binding protein 2